MASEAAAGDAGMTISPLVNADKKGDAKTIVLQKFDEPSEWQLSEGM